MNDLLALVLYIAVSITAVVLITVLHVRSMRQINPDEEYSVREELDPRKIISDTKERPQIMVYSFVMVLYMVAFRYDWPFAALVGSLLLIGTAWYTNKDSDTDESENPPA